MGVFFVYKVVAPHAIFFTLGFPRGIEDVLCAGGYFTKSVTYLSIYGLLFELPITLFLLTIVGLVAPAGLVRASRISIMRIAVFSAVAVPLWLLYEIGIVLSRFASRPITQLTNRYSPATNDLEVVL